jgi:CheY-like chemotaxis protein
MFKRILALTIGICFFLSNVSPYSQAQAGTVLGLPEPGSMVNLSPAYEPTIIKGITVHKDNPFLFDFIVDVGQDKKSGEPLKKEGEKLIKYFLASLAIPDKDVWVNLSPYEKKRMIPESLGQTDMGRDLLEQDYILKQITASLIYPEKQLGRTFWERVYAKAQQMYGTTQVPVNTFNKVWILADRAEVFEHDQTAFVVDSHLKVMLEEDYLALTKHQRPSSDPTHSIASQIVKAIILPELEKEVNTGKNFANLRQILNSLILANWYKKNLKQALLNQVYTDQGKVKGIGLNDLMVKEKIYDQYLNAYKKGVFNYIKEDVTAQGTIPRKYFSGGFGEARAVVTPAMTSDPAMLLRSLPGESGRLIDLAVLASLQGSGKTNAAMAGPLAGKTILVAEDDEGVRRAYGRLYKSLGADAILAENGERAFELYNNAVREGRQIDFVQSDMRMGQGINGVELAKQIRKDHPKARIVLVTAGPRFAGYALREAEIQGDPVPVLVKPVNSDDLVKVLTANPAMTGQSPIESVRTRPTLEELQAEYDELLSERKEDGAVDLKAISDDLYRLNTRLNNLKPHLIEAQQRPADTLFGKIIVLIDDIREELQSRRWYPEPVSNLTQVNAAMASINTGLDAVIRAVWKADDQETRRGMQHQLLEFADLTQFLANLKKLCTLKPLLKSSELQEFLTINNFIDGSKSLTSNIFIEKKVQDLKEMLEAEGMAPGTVSFLEIQKAFMDTVDIKKFLEKHYAGYEKTILDAFVDNTKDNPVFAVIKIYHEKISPPPAAAPAVAEGAAAAVPGGKPEYWEKNYKELFKRAKEMWQLHVDRKAEDDPAFRAFIEGSLPLYKAAKLLKFGNGNGNGNGNGKDAMNPQFVLTVMKFSMDFYKDHPKSQFRSGILNQNIANALYQYLLNPKIFESTARSIIARVPIYQDNPKLIDEMLVKLNAFFKELSAVKEEASAINASHVIISEAGKSIETRAADGTKLSLKVSPEFAIEVAVVEPAAGLPALDFSVLKDAIPAGTKEFQVGEGKSILAVRADNKLRLFWLRNGLKVGAIEAETAENVASFDLSPDRSKLLIHLADGTVSEKILDDIYQQAKQNAAMAVNGGIDLNTSNGMQWKVSKDGHGVEMNVDPALIAQVKEHGIDSLSPVILRMTPLISVWSLAGLQEPAVK